MRRGSVSLALSLSLMACGSDGGNGREGERSATVRTLAYVISECRDDGQTFTAQQALRIARGGAEEITAASYVLEPVTGDERPVGVCRIFGNGRDGRGSVVAGVLQRLGVTPDGSMVVFEVSSSAPLPLLRIPLLPPDDVGFFVIHADGSGLRRVAPPSRDRSFRVEEITSQRIGANFTGPLPFSPNGRMITYSDCAPCAAGAPCPICNEQEEAVQIFVLDLFSGQPPRQVTHLPFVPAASPVDRVTLNLRFLDDDTIVFVTSSNPDGSDHAGLARTVTVDIHRGTRDAVPLPDPIPGSQFDPTFQITGDRPTVGRITFFDDDPLTPDAREIFFMDAGGHVLQLTALGRLDTASPLLDVSAEQAFFVASADVTGDLRSNRMGNCQVFSVDVTGAQMQQLTEFMIDESSPTGCAGSPPAPACGIDTLLQDAVTHAVVFASSCELSPGSNPHGGQIFAMWPDGSGGNQLTRAGGRVVSGNGGLAVELPGPFAISAAR